MSISKSVALGLEVDRLRKELSSAEAERDRLRTELATEHKRQSAMRTLIAAQEGALSHYRSKQAEADEAVRTLDSERAANAALTAELAACREDAERYRWLREHWDDVNHPVDFIICNSFVTTLDADVDAARKGEGGVGGRN